MFRAAEKRFKHYFDGRAPCDLSGVFEPPASDDDDFSPVPRVPGCSVNRPWLSLSEQVELVTYALGPWSGGSHNNLYMELGPAAFDVPELMNRLRWTTLGMHYDWTRRTYEGCDVDALPPVLVKLGARARHGFVADAAIVNYYPVRYQLCGHRDDAEKCPLHPVVSMSLGLAAVFLIESPEGEPQALWLRSGDCCVMEGPSRYAMHGVPRVEPNTCPQELIDALKQALPGERGEAMANFLACHRLNINLRTGTCNCQERVD